MTSRISWRPTGRTGRGGRANTSPVLHAMTDVPAARVRDTGSRRALCGAGLTGQRLARHFDLDHPRACPRCVAEILARS